MALLRQVTGLDDVRLSSTEPGAIVMLNASKRSEATQRIVHDRLVKRRGTVWPADVELLEEAGEPVRGKAGADLNGEAEIPEQPANGRLAATEFTRLERLLAGHEPVRDPDDGLGVVRPAVVNEQVLARRLEPVGIEELILTELVVLRGGGQHLIPPNVPQRHGQTVLLQVPGSGEREAGRLASPSFHKMNSILQFVDRQPAPSLLPILRSQQQGEILALLLGDPDLELSLTEIAQRTGAPQPSVHREIERAERAGLVTSRKIGNTRLVARMPTAPITPDLRMS